MRRQPLGFTSSETQFAFLLRLTSTDALEVLEGAGHLPDLHLALNLDPRHVPLAAKLFWQPPGPACLSKWPSRGHCYWASRAGASQPRTQHPTCLSVAAPIRAQSPLPPSFLTLSSRKPGHSSPGDGPAGPGPLACLVLGHLPCPHCLLALRATCGQGALAGVASTRVVSPRGPSLSVLVLAQPKVPLTQQEVPAAPNLAWGREWDLCGF